MLYFFSVTNIIKYTDKKTEVTADLNYQDKYNTGSKIKLPF